MRLVTLELTIRLLTQIVMNANVSFLQDGHLAAIEGAKEESSSVLRNFYKVIFFSLLCKTLKRKEFIFYFLTLVERGHFLGYV